MVAKKLNRKIRRVSGKDPKLGIKDYEKWLEDVPKLEKIPHRLMKVLCEKTIESIKDNKEPVLWPTVVKESNVNRSTAQDWKRALGESGFLEELGRYRDGISVVATKRAMTLYFESVDKLYSELDSLIMLR